jgi:hypothetical protein
MYFAIKYELLAKQECLGYRISTILNEIQRVPSGNAALVDIM